MATDFTLPEATVAGIHEAMHAGTLTSVELMSVPYSEPRLIALASAYEATADARRPPEAAPPL